ncbi:MAG: septum formation inhibitor Maf [Lachnospiraceae bacterium]|jgi:septum formation protein|nr:septum formation inhibitor Maf [Lachnospiraceae bacterium]
MKKIVLASGSPRRSELLEQIGVVFEVHKAEGEEVITSTVPSEAVKELALQKAEEVAEKWQGDVIIGADTVVAAEGQILGKPENREDALRMLRLLSGKEHEVITGVAVILRESGKLVHFAETTKVRVYPMTGAQMERYADSGEPADKAGAYGIQGKFAAYVAGIEGDYNNVVGLPVGRLYQEVLAAGVDLLDLKNVSV